MSATPRFGRLSRHFLERFLDNDLMSPGAESHQGAVNVIALTGAMSFTVAVILGIKLAFRPENLAPAVAQRFAWTDQEFVLSLSMLIAAMATAINWDTLFPDRSDAMSLGPLPLSPRLLLASRLVAMAVFLGMVIVSANAFTTLIVPGLAMGFYDALSSYIRNLAAWVFTVAAASSAVFFAQLSLQAVLVNILPYRAYQRISAVLQLALLLGAFVGFFLMPSPPAALAMDPARAIWLPPYWFLSLYHYLAGDAPALPARFAAVGLVFTFASAALAIGLYAGCYRRVLRRVVESPEESPASRGRLLRIADACLAPWLLRPPRTRAVFWFIARTVTRHRRHRLLLAIAVAVGLAWITEAVEATLRGGAAAGSLLNPGPLLLSIPISLAWILIIGLRALYGIPVELRANWIFRLTEAGSPEAYLDGARRFLWVAAVAPFTLLPLPALIPLWGWAPALRHTAFVAILGLILIEVLLKNFRKMPFACSMMPSGKVRTRLGAWFILFGSLSSFCSALDWAVLRQPVAAWWIFGFSGAALGWMIWRRLRDESPRGLVFEEKLDPAFTWMQLNA